MARDRFQYPQARAKRGQPQTGLGLVEVLLTLSVLVFTLTAIGRLQWQALHESRLGGQQALALRLAENRMARLQMAFQAGALPAAGQVDVQASAAGERLDPNAATSSEADPALLFRCTWRIEAAAGGSRLWRLAVRVDWDYPHGTPRHLELYSLAYLPPPASPSDPNSR